MSIEPKKQPDIRHVALSALSRQAARNLCCNLIPERIPMALSSFSGIILAIVCSNRLSSALLHMSGTLNTIGAANATDAAARCVTLLTRFNHPRVGQRELPLWQGMAACRGVLPRSSSRPTTTLQPCIPQHTTYHTCLYLLWQPVFLVLLLTVVIPQACLCLHRDGLVI